MVPNWKNPLFQKEHWKILIQNENYSYLITCHDKNVNPILQRKRHRWNPCETNVTKATHLEILIIDSKPLPQVTENHRAVFLKLEVARHVFSETGCGIKFRRTNSEPDLNLPPSCSPAAKEALGVPDPQKAQVGFKGPTRTHSRVRGTEGTDTQGKRWRKSKELGEAGRGSTESHKQGSHTGPGLPADEILQNKTDSHS